MSDPTNDFEVIATADGWKIAGDIDAGTVLPLTEAFAGEHAEMNDSGVVVDVEGVTFIDSSGLRVLLDLSSRVGPGGVTLRAAPRSVRRLLELTGLSDMFRLEDAAPTERLAGDESAGIDGTASAVLPVNGTEP